MTKSIPEKIRSILLSKIPMGKMGSGEDVSNCVAFLSSDEASYITGETIHVNGGILWLDICINNLSKIIINKIRKIHVKRN